MTNYQQRLRQYEEYKAYCRQTCASREDYQRKVQEKAKQLKI